MRKLLVLAGLFILLSNVAFCEEVKQPEQQVNDNRATISVQKQPTTQYSQKQIAKQNKWCIIIQVNGKLQDEKEKLW